MPRKRDFETLIEDKIRDAVGRVYDKDSDYLKAIAIGLDWVKVKHKIDEEKEGAAFLGGDTDDA